MKGIAILGSTGSIGQSALAVVDAHPDRLRVVGLAANSNAERLAEQAERYRPCTAALVSESGPEALVSLATHPDADIVLFASSGTAGLDAVLAAIEAGKTIALANKEILVMAGALVMEAARRNGVAVLPVDSEHNAIHQCLHARQPSEVTRLILTASGGPFRTYSSTDLAEVTPDEALRHPTWRMGPKITIDSATLMNKGLEVIEARWLFDVGPDRIDVVVHPQSIVHSMVELVDGSIIAQLGVTDMRLPIQYTLSYPERWAGPLPSLDLARAARLDFEAPDTSRFPCLALAFRALRGPSGLPIVLNAANEMAVAAFLDGRIGFTAIPELIRGAMDAYEREGTAEVRVLEDVRAVDRWSREFTTRMARGVTIGCPPGIEVSAVATSILSFTFVLGVLIFVHELGHFIMARRIGVRVLTFSLGFGPKLLKFRRGDTEYCISAIPLGGYVKMAGENPEDARTGADDEFLSKSKWQRFQVLVMGPIMNLALALIVMSVVLYQGAEVPAFDQLPVVIGSFTATSPAKAVGLRPGDQLVSIDGKTIENWDRYSIQIASKAKRQTTLGVLRDGKTFEVQIVPASLTKFEMGDLGILPIMHPEVESVDRDRPAAEAGLRPGDVVLAAGGERDVTQRRLIEIIQAHENQPLPLDIRRQGEQTTVTVTPRKIGPAVIMGAHLNPYEVRTINPGPMEAVKLSFDRNWEWSKLIVQTLAGLFTRETSVKQLMGPVGIAEMTGTAAEQSWVSLFSLMAMISLNLGLLNLMPVPVLDGGHIAILAMEGLSRRDFSMRVKEKMLLAGFVLLLMLMATVIYNDLMRFQWIERLMPWR